jgi:ATP-dependent exoDNAse (exonuclease V) beta subunit
VTVEVVSASAGTGKTTRLSRDVFTALLDGSARPEGVVAITYTVKAAGELESRIRSALLEEGRPDLAARIRDGYLGTIHSVCQRLLREFALEAGLSPFLEPIPESERRHLFDRSLSRAVAGKESRLNELARRLSLDDWREELRQIVDKARENGMDAAALQASARASRETFGKILAPVTLEADGYAERFRSQLDQVAPALQAAAAAAPGNASAQARAAEASRLQAETRRFGLPPWKDQLQLASTIDLKNLRPVTGELVDLVRAHHESASFQGELLELQAALFELAAQAIEALSAEKAASRVLDFGDMLALAHRLLERPAVQEALRARLDLVLVDEFQDTSPIQLAVVAALGAVARRSIWVGDRKQAIFAFQGSDPELMSAAIDWALEGKPPDILGTSYRSRKPLVELVSDLFSSALAPHGFPAEQVRLVAARPDPEPLAQAPAVESWRWIPEKADRGGETVAASEAHAVAAGVQTLLASPPMIRERVEGGADRLRPAARLDVAVLAFSNDRCREIAAALQARGIPARVSLEGLTSEPESLLVRAALALLADPSDGIAALELSWLGGHGAADPDGWLSRRMVEVAEWRAAREEAEERGERGPVHPQPFAGDPRVAALRSATAAHLSPAEALDLALRAGGIPELLRTWPEPERRLANVEALRAEARAYEELCAARRTAATVLGLVQHLAELGEDAEQAAPSAEDAVHVTTWHGAKGLEWPVVVLSHLDFARRRSVFDVAVEPAASFDFAAPLADRWVRYWPWPYGRMTKGLALLTAADLSPEAARTSTRERKERARLLYVGFTRARDLLVAIAKVDPKRGPVVPALAPLDDEEGKPTISFPFEASEGTSAVRVGDRDWQCTVRAPSGLPCEPAPAARTEIGWYAAGPRVKRPPERLNPSSEPRGGAAKLVSVLPLAGRQQLAAGAVDMGPVGDAIHAFLAADQLPFAVSVSPRSGPESNRGTGTDDSARSALASRLLAAHGVQGVIDPRALLAVSDALRRWLGERYLGATWLREWPVRARIPGDPSRLLVGEVDLCLELPDGFVLVDHKSFPGGERERDRRVVEEWAPQLGWYASALEKALGKPLKAAYIHLPIRGEMVEVRLGEG